MRNLAVLLWAVCAMNSNSYASDGLVIKEETLPSVPTVIMGEAVTPSGKVRKVTVEQPDNAPNPLGNPIVVGGDEVMPNKPEPKNNAEGNALSEKEAITQSAPLEELKPNEVPLPQPSSNMESELYQSGDDIVDVQAYPIDDVKKVTEPNIQPTMVSD